MKTENCIFKKPYLSYMARLESGRTCERWNGFACSQGLVRLFSFALPPDSIELPAPVPLQLVLSFSLYLAGLKHKSHILDSLHPCQSNIKREADVSYPGPCGARFEHEP